MKRSYAARLTKPKKKADKQHHSLIKLAACDIQVRQYLVRNWLDIEQVVGASVDYMVFQIGHYDIIKKSLDVYTGNNCFTSSCIPALYIPNWTFLKQLESYSDHLYKCVVNMMGNDLHEFCHLKVQRPSMHEIAATQLNRKRNVKP